jgi:hypothetical protein
MVKIINRMRSKSINKHKGLTFAFEESKEFNNKTQTLNTQAVKYIKKDVS